MKLPDEIQKLIMTLENSKGYKCINQMEGSGFGDCLLEMQSSIGTRIRFVRDRGDWFVEASGCMPSSKWYELSLIKTLFGGNPSTHPMSLDRQMELLQNELRRIEELFGPEQLAMTEGKLNHIQNERAKRLFPSFYKTQQDI